MMTAFEEWERNRWRCAPIDLQEKVVELIVSDARWRATREVATKWARETGTHAPLLEVHGRWRDTREAAAKWARAAGMKECQALVDRLSSK